MYQIVLHRYLLIHCREDIYCCNSAFLYSEYYGLNGSRGMKLTDDIMNVSGILLGFWSIDGRIPGGVNNAVTVSIKVKVIK